MIDDGARAAFDTFLGVITGQREVDELRACLRPEHELFGGVSHDDPVVGVEALHELVRYFRIPFDDWKVADDVRFDDGVTLVARFTVDVTHARRLGSIRPSRRRIAVTGILACELEGQRIKKSWLELSALAVMQQIGGLELVDPMPEIQS